MCLVYINLTLANAFSMRSFTFYRQNHKHAEYTKYWCFLWMDIQPLIIMRLLRFFGAQPNKYPFSFFSIRLPRMYSQDERTSHTYNRPRKAFLVRLPFRRRMEIMYRFFCTDFVDRTEDIVCAFVFFFGEIDPIHVPFDCIAGVVGNWQRSSAQYSNVNVRLCLCSLRLHPEAPSFYQRKIVRNEKAVLGLE